MTQTIDQFLVEWASAEHAGDTSRLEGMLTDDFLGVGPLGFVLPKQAWVARYRNGLAYDRFHLEELQPRQHGDTAIVTARQVGTGTIGGAPLPFETVRATLSLTRHDTRWKLAGIHMSFIAGTPGAPPIPTTGHPATNDDD